MYSEYINFIGLGFWFGIGVIQSIIVFLVITWLIPKLINWITKPDPSYEDYVFKALPEEFRNMSLMYDEKTKVLTAYASVYLNDQLLSYTDSVEVTKKELMKEFAHQVQLRILLKVQKESNNV